MNSTSQPVCISNLPKPYLGKPLEFSGQWGKIRLRAAESESDYFLKLINVPLFRKIILFQVTSLIIFIVTQIILHSEALHGNIIMVGLWSHILFVAPTCYLTYLATVSPSGCTLRTAMTFSILSALAAFLECLTCAAFLIIVARPIPEEHFDESGVAEDPDPYYSEEICASIILLVSVFEVVLYIVAALHYCKIVGCCARPHFERALLFNVETASI